MLAAIGGCDTGPAQAPATAPVRSVFFGDLRLPGDQLDDPTTRRQRRLDFAAVTGPASARPGGTWEAARAAAERAYEPGAFTTFAAVDYLPDVDAKTAMRTVILRGAEQAGTPPGEPQPRGPAALWAWMDELRDLGIETLAVAQPAAEPALPALPADAFVANAAEQRARNEPLAAMVHAEDQPAIDSALGYGITLESRGGSNPFQFGLVAGGAHVNGAAGLTGVWATANTREAIYAALRRRETFATGGQRIALQLVAGAAVGDEAPAGSAAGITMGGDLLPAMQEPQFFARAVADPDGAPLQRLQMIKGWVAGGTTHQQVYDIACADGANPDSAAGRCPDGAAAPCDPGAAAGTSRLEATWQDPAFPTDQEAYYYLRVLAGAGCEATPQAWSSPIWYHGGAREAPAPEPVPR